MRALHVARPVRGGEPVTGVVGQAHGLILVREPDDSRHGTEDLFARHPRAVVDAIKDRVAPLFDTPRYVRNLEAAYRALAAQAEGSAPKQGVTTDDRARKELDEN